MPLREVISQICQEASASFFTPSGLDDQVCACVHLWSLDSEKYSLPLSAPSVVIIYRCSWNVISQENHFNFSGTAA